MSHRRKTDEKQRLLKLYGETRTRYGSGAWIDRRGRLYRYYPYSANINVKKQFRRIASRKFRRMRGELVPIGRSGYKRVFDLWWTIT